MVFLRSNNQWKLITRFMVEGNKGKKWMKKGGGGGVNSVALNSAQFL